VQQPLNNKQSQAVKANGQIFLSGQIPADKNGNLVEGDIRTKTQACCDNIKAILDAAGSSVDKIIRVNVSRVMDRHVVRLGWVITVMALGLPR
jgi:enamine deaminase RidA (YjgF/YER057c/UK114 family)